MDRVREIFLYFVAGLSMFALLCAVYQAINDKNGSALALGAIFLVGALIVFIPELEVLKALGSRSEIAPAFESSRRDHRTVERTFHD